MADSESTVVLKQFEDEKKNDEQTLSRRQKNRLAKREHYLSIRPQLRQAEREKRKEKKRKKQEEGQESSSPKKPCKRKMEESVCKVRLVIDMQYDNFMNDREMNKALKQLQFSYSANRKQKNPVQFYITSMSGRVKTTFDGWQGTSNWDVNVCEDPYWRVFEESKAEDIVYLTSESDNVLSEVDDKKIYIIGGLVDHNRHKGLAHKLATERGVSHARLPIQDLVQMDSRTVLTINHVFEIMLRYLESHDWQDAILSVIPERKGASVRKPDAKVDEQIKKEISCELAKVECDSDQ